MDCGNRKRPRACAGGTAPKETSTVARRCTQMHIHRIEHVNTKTDVCETANRSPRAQTKRGAARIRKSARTAHVATRSCRQAEAADRATERKAERKAARKAERKAESKDAYAWSCRWRRRKTCRSSCSSNIRSRTDSRHIDLQAWCGLSRQPTS